MLNWLVGSRWFLAVTLLGAITLATALGILGVGHGGLARTNLDMRVLYLAGVAWHDGVSAYQPSLAHPVDAWLLDARYDFAYPPQIAPLCLGLAMFSLPAAKGLMTAINIVSAVLLAVFSIRVVRTSDASGAVVPGDASAWLIPALVLGNFSTAFVIWAGQTTLIVTAALMLGWYCARRDQWLLGGVLLAIATIKPQVSFLAIGWLVLERRWRALAVAALSVVTFAAVPLVVSGPLHLMSEWAMAAQVYATGSYNVLGSRMIFGVQNLVHVAGINAPILLPVAMLLGGVLWYCRSRIADQDLLAILVSLSLLFGFAHSYDIVALTPLIPAFWRHVHASPNASALALVLLLCITLPNSVFEPLHVPALYHARVVALAAAVTWLLAMNLRGAPAPRQACADEHLRPQEV